MSKAEPVAATENPHVLWRQVTGLVLWTGVVSYFGGGLFGQYSV